MPILIESQDTYSTPTLGMPTTCGSFALAQGRAKSNAKIVDVLLAAGMVVIGKANMSVRKQTSLARQETNSYFVRSWAI
jgi:amidase